MEQGKSLTIISVILLGFILQVLLIIADTRETPRDATIEFSRAYFQLEPSMQDYLCKDLIDDDAVDQYLYRMGEDARSRGFDISYLKAQVYDIETRTHIDDGADASVHFSAKIVKSINPVFAFVGKLFHLVDVHEVEDTIHLVKEDGKWKVCGSPFSLTAAHL